MAPAKAGATFSFPAFLAPLSDGVVLLAVGDAACLLEPARVLASGEDGPLRPPFSWHRVPAAARGGAGAALLLVALAQPALAVGRSLTLERDDGPAAATLPIAGRDAVEALLAAPGIDAAGPAAGLAALRFIASKVLGTLRRAEDAGVARSCLRLAAALLDANRAAAQPLARAGDGAVLYGLPADAPRKRPGTAAHHVLIGPTGLRRVPASGRAVLLPARQALGGAVLLPAESGDPVRLAPPAPAAALPSLTDLGRRTDPNSRALHRDALAALAAGAEPAQRLLRDLRLVGGAEPARACAAPEHPFGGALDLAVPDGAGGVFLRGWLRDPLGLVSGLALRCPGGVERPLPFAALARFARPDLAEAFKEAPHGGAGARPGFAVHLPDAGALHGGQWGLRLSLTTGDTANLVAPPGPAEPRAARDAVLGAVAARHLTPELLRGAVAPAVERLHRAVMAGRGAPEVVRIGAAAAARRPDVALVVPLYRNLRFLRHQYAAFARDPLLRDTAELVYVLDSPEQREDLEHMLRGLHGVCGMPVTLVVQAANYGYASACNAGVAAAAAAAPVLALVNSDVVPAARGWLRPLLRELDRLSDGGRAPAAVGPKLLFEDGSLQHAGLFFEPGPGGEWFNSHYWKGFPRFHPPAQAVREVPGVTGALLCLRRSAFEAAGGFCTDYVVGDYEDSDLCLRLREAGGAIAFVPEAELYHFERQSIRDHGGYARTSACNYNRALHHARWAPAIEALMARFPGAAAPKPVSGAAA